MASFATTEWFEELDRSVGELTVDPTIDVVLEHRLTDGVDWQVIVRQGRVSVRLDATEPPAVTLTSSTEVARAIHTGEMSAQRAFLDGALRIGGDINILIAQRDLLAAVAETLAVAT